MAGDDLLPMERITSVEVGSLLVTCGMCGHAIEIGYEALDQENGRVDPAEDFDECPQCGCLHDAQAATFSAFLSTATKEGGA